MAARLGLMVLATVVACGCTQVPATRTAISEDGRLLPPRTGEGLVPRKDPAIADVPMPIGFVLIEDHSRAEVAVGTRYVEQMYQGVSTLGEAVRFYRSHLPRQGWRPLGEAVEAGVFIMRYTKGDENLELRIAQQKVRTTVSVTIRDETAPAL
jgi:hypothetical protein